MYINDTGGLAMIELKNISKRYSGGHLAVNNISLKVNDGEIFGFLGPNGAGKTTTIKMITGIIRQDFGEIILNNMDTIYNPRLSKKEFGYVPDSPDVFLKLKGIEYLNFMGDMYEVESNIRNERIQYLCEKLSMESALKDKIESYSHGMRQKIVIIGALLHNPKIWILDEPLTGLDPKSAFVLKEMMREHAAQGNTVFFSTHVLEVAEKLCDRVAIINKGKLAFCGALAEMREEFKGDSNLENMFLEMTSHE